MHNVIVRYKVKPEHAEENAELVRAVYAELQQANPPGFRYATFQLDDGVSFVHVASTEAEPPPLPGMEAFKRFQEGLAERCDEPPVAVSATKVGSFRFG